MTSATNEFRANHAPAVRRTLAVILVLNLVVVAVKVSVGVRTGALSVLGAALESGLDLLNNVVGIVLVRIAARGPDEDHPYGHEKFETLGTLAIVGFLSISCFELLREGVHYVIDRHAPKRPSLLELALILATMGINLLVVWYERRRYGSFYRSIPLPEGVNDDNVSATFDDGVLEVRVRVPEQQQRRGKKIEIK